MKHMSLQEITAACHGQYFGGEAVSHIEVAGVAIDSRKIEKDWLFIPIKGARVDGHSFIPQVMEKGALCTLSEVVLENVSHPYILVDSCEQALKDIAEHYRKALDIKVVGITGSVGKTSTKEMIASVLEQKYHVLKTAGNFNNEIGLPLTIFNIRDEHEIAVLEMGINHFGEMHRLAKMARPDICVITNIGLCHLENLIDRDGILKAKTEMFDFMQPDAKIILNGDDDKLITVTDVKGQTPMFFGLSTELDAFADNIHTHSLKGVSCTLHLGDNCIDTMIPIPGNHMVYNALAGALVGRELGLTAEEIKKGIESLTPVSGRNNMILFLSSMTATMPIRCPQRRPSTCSPEPRPAKLPFSEICLSLARMKKSSTAKSVYMHPKKGSILSSVSVNYQKQPQPEQRNSPPEIK